MFHSISRLLKVDFSVSYKVLLAFLGTHSLLCKYDDQANTLKFNDLQLFLTQSFEASFFRRATNIVFSRGLDLVATRSTYVTTYI